MTITRLGWGEEWYDEVTSPSARRYQQLGDYFLIFLWFICIMYVSSVLDLRLSVVAILWPWRVKRRYVHSYH